MCLFIGSEGKLRCEKVDDLETFSDLRPTNEIPLLEPFIKTGPITINRYE